MDEPESELGVGVRNQWGGRGEEDTRLVDQRWRVGKVGSPLQAIS
jgi:hypothetical protein